MSDLIEIRISQIVTEAKARGQPMETRRGSKRVIWDPAGKMTNLGAMNVAIMATLRVTALSAVACPRETGSHRRKPVWAPFSLAIYWGCQNDGSGGYRGVLQPPTTRRTAEDMQRYTSINAPDTNSPSTRCQRH